MFPNRMGGRSKGWWYYFKQSIQIYRNANDRFIGQEANGNRYYERMLAGKMKRYVLNDRDLDIPGKKFTHCDLVL